MKLRAGEKRTHQPSRNKTTQPIPIFLMHHIFPLQGGRFLRVKVRVRVMAKGRDEGNEEGFRGVR
jgi:hypothetical protein